MYIYHKGVQYSVPDVLSRGSCEIHLYLNGQSKKWEAKVYWNWDKMDERDYEGDSIEAVLSKAARDRVEEGEKES